MRFAIFSHRLTRRATAAMVTFGLVIAASSALALNKQDILNMQASGLDATIIVQVIRSSTDAVTITEAEVEELRAAGVAEPVLSEVCVRIGCASSITPGPGDMGPVGPGPVGPNLNAEIERQRQLEEERIRLEQERMERERADMRTRIEQEAARANQVAAAFTALDDADRDFRNRRFARSAAAYNDFLVNVAPAPESNEYYQALCGFVRAMHAGGYRQVVRHRALEAVLRGPGSEHFEEMFGILVDVTNDAGYLDPQFESLTGFTVGGFSQPFQDEFNFFLGRFFWTYGESRRALEYFGRVSNGSDHKAQAHYLSAVIYLDLQEQSQLQAELQGAIVRTELNGSDPEVAELAYLALARITYEINQNDAALYYYRKIGPESPRHTTTMFETAWTYFMKADWNRAIGSLHTLHSPYYNDNFFPDLYVVEAATYLQVCNLDASEEALAVFFDQTAEMQGAVQNYLATYNQPQVFLDAVLTYHELEGTGRQADLPEQAVRYVLADTQFRNEVQRLNQLDREREQLRRDNDGLGEYGQQALAGIGAEIETQIASAGIVAQRKVMEFEQELTDWNIKAQEVAIEVSTERLVLLERSLEDDAGRDGGTTTFVLAQDWQYWPFEGEYWLDEVDNYRGNLSSNRDDTGRCFEPVAPVEE